MSTEHKNPFEGVTDYFSELSRLRTLGVHGSSAEHTHETAERTHASAWVPTTDILAVGEDLVIRLELAGVAPDDVDLRFSHGALTVSGSRASDADAASYLVRERYHGAFRRVVTLPERVTEADLSARFEAGVVEVTVRGGATADLGSRIALQDRSSAPTTRGVSS